MEEKTKIHFVPGYLQNPTHKISIGLIGCGGTGSQVLNCLARMNATLIAIGHPGLHVTAFDGDEVTPANMGRQLFSASDIGREKSIVLIERINRFFNLNWEAIPHSFQQKDVLCYNISITCVDNMDTRLLIQKMFTTGKRAVSKARNSDLGCQYYWMDFGNNSDSGQVVLGSRRIKINSKFEKFEPVPLLPTVFDLYPAFKTQKSQDTGPSCSVAEAIAKQDLFVNSTLAQLGCNILWKLIKEGSIEHHGLFMNLKTMNVKPINV